MNINCMSHEEECGLRNNNMWFLQNCMKISAVKSIKKLKVIRIIGSQNTHYFIIISFLMSMMSIICDLIFPKECNKYIIIILKSSTINVIAFLEILYR